MLETPYLVIDEQKMMKNIRKMASMARANGVRLRPHVKTHKIPQIAQRQLSEGAAGITVAKVSEAEVMKEQGIVDIFIAYPLVVESKIERALKLASEIKLVVGVDSLIGARRLSEAARRRGQTLDVRLEVDTGLQRTGVLYGNALGLAAEIIGLDNIHLTGIYTYRGSLLRGEPTLETSLAGVEEGTMMAALARTMREAGMHIQDVSVGSTPTAESVCSIEGVTEIRPGTYVFFDRMQTEFGACTMDECAATVVATVVSKPLEDLVIIDGGSKTFATDVQPNSPPLYLKGFGHICGYPQAVFQRMTEEHGMIRLTGTENIEVGDRLEIIPNHICSTVNLHNFAYLRNDQGLSQLSVAARGRLD